jgi:hypothetical protein
VADRRIVRVTEAFFAQLDEQLGPDRGAGGQPSATDFLVLDLPTVVERFATEFESLPEVADGFSAARFIIAPGVLVRAFAVYGLLLAGGSIDIIGLELDLGD